MSETEQLLASATPSWMVENRPIPPAEAFAPSKDWPMSPTLQRKERILATDVFNQLTQGGGGGSSGANGQLQSIVALNGYPRNALLDGTDLGPA